MSLPAYQTVRLERAAFPASGRVLMISDIHGHAAVLRRLLRRAAFTKDDVLVVVGDLLEKGEESLAVIRELMALSRTHTVYTLMGNMDVWTLSKLLSDDPAKRHVLFARAPLMKNWWGGCLLIELCRELDVPFREDMDEAAVVRLIRRRFEAELSFMTSLPAILDTERMTFVHGGLPHLNFEELVGTDSDPLLKCDDFLSRGLSFPKWVTVGHWPAVLYRTDRMDMSPLIRRDRRILCLDGGCGVKRSGQLNCVIWPDRAEDAFSFVWEDGLPRLTALADQAPSASCTYIRYHDRDVTVLSDDGPDFALVRWHGKEVRVPLSALDRETPGRLNTDFTDYVLPVRKGDSLSLVARVGDGLYVRKDGVLGWYRGPAEPQTEERPSPEKPL